jgi:hypothetical protein
MSVDPGTLHTGVAIFDISDDGKVLEILTLEYIKSDPKKHAKDRIADILGTIVSLVDHYKVEAMWVELYVPLGRNRGAMYNMSLVGALLYMPITRQRDLSSFGVFASQWKRWFKKTFGESDYEADLRHWFEAKGFTLTDQQLEALTVKHVRDAVGILLYAAQGGLDEKHETSD